jgi:hypothetical protein
VCERGESRGKYSKNETVELGTEQRRRKDKETKRKHKHKRQRETKKFTQMKARNN